MLTNEDIDLINLSITKMNIHLVELKQLQERIDSVISDIDSIFNGGIK